MGLQWHTDLTGPTVEEIRGLADAAAAADGSPALNDDALIALERPGRHLLARADGHLAGYAQLTAGDPPTAQVVVAPDDRGRGWGARLVTELLQTAGPPAIWAFGDHRAAGALARRFGLRPARSLLLMSRSLVDPLPEVPDPPGVRFRGFSPGPDDAAFLFVNARAFAHHPEQGRMTQADLDARKAASWFDPAGFILAESGVDDLDRRKGRLLGYHWTKSHGPDTGEVYVLGVDPGAAGRGLGTALLHHGVTYLRHTGHRRVILYVEEAEERVVRLYRRYGFSEASRDVMYARRPDDSRPRQQPSRPHHAAQEHHGSDRQRG